MFSDYIEYAQIERIIDREIWLRLAKYRSARMKSVSRLRPDCVNYASNIPNGGWPTTSVTSFHFGWVVARNLKKVKVTPKHRRALVTWLQENPTTDHWHEDDWRERCKRDFRPQQALYWR